MNFFRKTNYILDILLKLFKIFLWISLIIFFLYLYSEYAKADTLDIDFESGLPATWSAAPTYNSWTTCTDLYVSTTTSACDNTGTPSKSGRSTLDDLPNGYYATTTMWFNLKTDPNTNGYIYFDFDHWECGYLYFNDQGADYRVLNTSSSGNTVASGLSYGTWYFLEVAFHGDNYTRARINGGSWSNVSRSCSTGAGAYPEEIEFIMGNVSGSHFRIDDLHFEDGIPADTSYLFSLYPSGGEEVIGMSNTVQWTYNVHFGEDDFETYGVDYMVRIIDEYNGEYNVQDIYNFYDVDTVYPAVNILYEPVHIGYGWHNVYWDIISIATSTYGQSVYSTTTTYYLIQAGEPGGYVGIASTTLFLDFASTSDIATSIYDFLDEVGNLISSIAPFSIPFHIKECWDDATSTYTGLEILGIDGSEDIEVNFEIPFTNGATTSIYFWGPDLFDGNEEWLSAWYQLTTICQWGFFFIWLTYFLFNLYREINKNRPS